MQVQIKKQLKIELDQADIVEAVGNHLKANGINVCTADLEKINFVKSPKDGLRAELNIVEETETETAEEAVQAKPVEEATPAVEPEPATVAEEEDDEPGVIASSTVADVAVDEAVERALVSQPEEEPATVANEEEGEVPAADERRKLFH